MTSDAYQEGMAAAEKCLAEEIIRLILAGDMNAPVLSAPVDPSGSHPKLASVINDSLWLNNSPDASDMMRFIGCHAGGFISYKEARQLVERLALAYARTYAFFEG